MRLRSWKDLEDLQWIGVYWTAFEGTEDMGTCTYAGGGHSRFRDDRSRTTVRKQTAYTAVRQPFKHGRGPSFGPVSRRPGRLFRPCGRAYGKQWTHRVFKAMQGCHFRTGHPRWHMELQTEARL